MCMGDAFGGFPRGFFGTSATELDDSLTRLTALSLSIEWLWFRLRLCLIGEICGPASEK